MQRNSLARKWQDLPAEETLTAFRIIYVLIPTLAMIGAYLDIRGFRLDKDTQTRLRSEIEARDTGTP